MGELKKYIKIIRFEFEFQINMRSIYKCWTQPRGEGEGTHLFIEGIKLDLNLQFCNFFMLALLRRASF